MNSNDDRFLTPKERAEIEARKIQIQIQKKNGIPSTLDFQLYLLPL